MRHPRAHRLVLLPDVQRVHLTRIRDSRLLIRVSGAVTILRLGLLRRRRYILPISGHAVSIIDSRRGLIHTLLLEMSLLIARDASTAMRRHRARI